MYLIHLVNRTGLCLLLSLGVMGAAFAAGAPALPDQATTLPAGVSGDWWGAVQRDIAEKEYSLSWQESGGVLSFGPSWQAPNRAHDLRTYFTDSGPRVVQRTKDQPEWVWGLELVSVNGQPAPEVEKTTAKGNRFEYVRAGGVTEWYVNDARGLEQGFTLTGTEGSQDFVTLDLGVRGDLRGGMMPGGDVVEFLSSGGVGIIHFGGLKSWDATGRALAGSMELVEGEVVRLMVDARDAVYPITIDPIATTAAWTAEGDQDSGGFGYSVATAGDINNDGYSDVIIGAPQFDGAQVDVGAAFVYLGSAAGLGATAAWSVQGTQGNGQYGCSVAPVGDVTGDGYGDIIVGAFNVDVDSDAVGEGAAYVYYGSAAGPSTTADWTGTGGMDYEFYGRSVATAGDVNGDGFSDIIVGASGYSNGEANEGRAYAYYGSSSGLGAGPSWSYESNSALALAGALVATAGDVNGDGYSDAVVTAYALTSGEANEGAAFVFHGGAAGLSAAPDWTVQGNSVGAYYGYAAGTAGDVNGDGYADLIVGAWQYTASFSTEGMVFVYHGSAAGLAVTENFRARGNAAGVYLGCSVGTAGDLNGDGYGDVVVGATNYAVGEAGEGAVFSWFGSPTGLFAGTQAVPDLPTAADWSVQSNQIGANLGFSAATAGDVNGDGYSDIIASAIFYDNPENNEGRVSVFYGSAGIPSASVSWRVDPINEANANAGYSVASAGDVNGDGYGDVIVGAPYYDGGTADQGIALIYVGTATGLGTASSWSRTGGSAGALHGYCVTSAGDLNGDGYGDVAVGGPGYTNGETNEGRVLVYHGSAGGPAGANQSLESNVASSGFGRSVAWAGDVNGDGYSDLIVGAPQYANGEIAEGRVYVYYGRSTGIVSSASWMIESNAANALLGGSVAGAGDVNADGYDDVIIGAVGAGTGGVAYTHHGSASGLAIVPTWTGTTGQAGANYGVSVAGAGDVNGDGFSDVIVGASLYNNTVADEGRAYVYYGAASGIGGTPWGYSPGQVNAQVGASVAGAGDMNGDGFSEVVIGAPLFDGAGPIIDEGRVFTFRGTATGVGAVVLNMRLSVANIKYGFCVAGAGDVNGDGFADLILGVPEFHPTTAPVKRGRVYLHYGNSEYGGVVGLGLNPRQTKTDGTLLGPKVKSDKSTMARVLMQGRTPFGRSKVALQVEAKPLGVPFNGLGLQRSVGWTDGLVSGADVERVLTGLTKSTVYRWRARLIYQPATSPFQKRSRWITTGWNALTENDFRTATPPANPSNAGATDITTDSITWTWTDNSSDETGFAVWADQGSADPLVQRALAAVNTTSHVYGGLETNTQYAFQVAATGVVGDSDKTPTITAWTLARVPTAPVVSNPAGTSLDVAIGSGDLNPAYTIYAIAVSPLVGGNGWVQADGSVGASAVYRTAADWGTVTVSGLASVTEYTFTVTAQNGGGVNTAASPPGTGTTVDGTGPTGTLVINAGAAYTTNATVTLDLTADDGGGSGVADMRFSEDNASWGAWVPFAASSSFPLSGMDGLKAVFVQFRDVVGNISTGDISDTIRLETSIPTGTISINSGASCTGTAGVALELSSDDGLGSGVADMQFSEDGTTWGAWVPFATSHAFTLTGADGLKTVYAQFRDVAGNISAPVNAGITLDTAGPVGTVTINGGAAYTANAIVSLALTGDDGAGCGVAQMRFSEDGSTWSAWEAFALVRGFTLSGTDGPKTVFMELQDSVGNISAAPVSAGITLDTTGPAGTLTIDGGSAYATAVGVSLALTADDGTGSGVTDMRFSDDGVTWGSWEGYSALRAYTLTGADGLKTVYAEFRDALGNVSAAAAQDSITLDVNAPTGTVTIDAGAAYAIAPGVTLTLGADDGTGSGLAEMRFSEDGSAWGAWETYDTSRAFTLTGADGTKTVFVEFRDMAGNVSAPAAQDEIVLDANAPTGTLQINSGAAYATSALVMLSFTMDDGTGSGVADVRLSEDGTNWGAWQAYAATTPFSLTGADGIKTVFAEFRDAAGNVSATAAQASITLDTQLPTGTVSIDGGAAHALVAGVSLALTADDGTGSGVVDMRFSQDGTNWTVWETYAATAAYTLSGADGTKTVLVELRDAAGNVSSPAPQDTIILDTQPPSGWVVINFGDAYTNVSTVALGLSASDSGGAGVSEMRFSDDNASWTGWEPYAVSRPYTFTGADGVKTVYVQYRDAVGRESASFSDTIELDRAAPTALISQADASPTTSPIVHYTVTFSEVVTPVFDASQVVVTGALSAIPTVTGTGPYTVTLFINEVNPDGLTGINLVSGITDLAGNALVVVPAVAYDIVYWPGFAGQPQGADKYVDDNQVFGVSVNPGSRVPSYQWKCDNGTPQNGPSTQSWDLGVLVAAEAGEYWCEVAYGGLVFPSTRATLRVRDRIAITQPPTGANVVEGVTYQFTVIATGGYAPLSYQWKKDGADIAGAESDSYTLAGVEISDSGDYSVEVSDANADAIESVTATLLVDNAIPVAGWIALTALAAGLAGFGVRRAKK